MRKLGLILVFALLAAGLALASPTPEAAVKTVVIGTTDKATNLDPAEAYDFHTWELFYNVYNGLLSYAPGTTEIVPALAESYSANAAGDVFTFKLRPGVKFTDGSPFNAQAVKWSVDRVMRLEGDPSWLVTSYVKSVDVVDDLTVRFNLQFPCAYFHTVVATPPYYPVSPSIYPADKIIWDPAEMKGGQLVGLGAYKMVSFKRDEEVILEANPNYWGKKPDVGRVVIRYYADATTLRLAMEQGEIDIAHRALNPSDITDLSANKSFTTYKLPGPQIRYLCFETSESVFKNKILRQAVAAAINRQDILQKVYLGQNAPLYSMVPNGMIYHSDDFKSVFGDGNVQKANQLLAQAGYSASKPFQFELWYTPSHYGDPEVNMAEVMKANLEKANMKVTLKSAEWAAYKEKWGNKEMPAFFLGWYPDYIDPDNYTAAFASTAGSAGMGIYFSDPEWDALFTKEQSNPDPKVREAVFKEIQQRWTVEVPTAPIWQGNLYLFSKPNIKGVKIGAPLQFLYSELTVN
jgi:peptide/nickel transport system substrate-binding protein